MAIKILVRRCVALLLCCVLVWGSFPVEAFATDPVTAASLAITGGQLAGAGLSGEAALSLAGPVGAVVGVTLGALGINAYVSKAAQEVGKTRTRFVLDKLVIWGAQAGYTKEQLYSKIAQGISVAADGTIQLASDAALTIQQFGNWLISTDGEVVPPSGSSGGSTINLGSLALPYGLSFTMSDYISGPDNLLGTVYTMSSDAAFIICSDGYRYSPYFVCNEPFTWNRVLPTGQTGSSPSASYYNGYYYLNTLTSYNVSRFTVSNIDVYNGDITTFLGSLDGTWNPGSTDIADEVFTGTPETWVENKDVLSPAGDTPVTLNPDLLNPIIDSLADGQQATMSIIDYLQALQDAWDRALDDVQTAIGTITDTLTGIQEQIAIPQDAVENPTVTNPSVTPDTTPILDPSDVDPGTAVTGLSFDLTQIFPFCIPFDIYAMLATLSATPEAPVYHVHYEGPYNILIDFTVDLSPWDSVAAVLRTVELLAFCIGLAYVTRSMFIRS